MKEPCHWFKGTHWVYCMEWDVPFPWFHIKKDYRRIGIREATFYPRMFPYYTCLPLSCLGCFVIALFLVGQWNPQTMLYMDNRENKASLLSIVLFKSYFDGEALQSSNRNPTHTATATKTTPPIGFIMRPCLYDVITVIGISEHAPCA